jgi:hypothetical protein
MANIDRARLAQITGEVSAILGAQELGTFRPERMPHVDIPANTIRATRLTAAVSPECSYRLVSEVLNSAQRTLLIYVYEIKADYLIDLVSKAQCRGVQVKMMYDRGGTHAADREGRGNACNDRGGGAAGIEVGYGYADALRSG